MGLLDRIFKGDTKPQEKKPTLSWKLLQSEEDLTLLKNESEKHLVVIFKHSTRCGISRMALKRFENEFDFSEEKVSLYLLDILGNRSLSNEIAADFEVHHQSPQLLIIQNGKVIYHTSHGDISAEKIGEFL